MMIGKEERLLTQIEILEVAEMNAIQRLKDEKKSVPIHEKAILTLDEATSYFNIGENKLKSLSDDDDCPFVIWVGSHRRFKRKVLEEYLNSQYSI